MEIHTVARPVHAFEPIQREDLLCYRKLIGKGQMSEIKTVTGWTIDTRCFIVSLAIDKVAAWSNLIRDIISQGTTIYKEIDSLIGQPLRIYNSTRLSLS